MATTREVFHQLLDAAKSLEVRIDVGHRRPSRTLGLYYPASRKIWIKPTLDIKTGAEILAHELGHAAVYAVKNRPHLSSRDHERLADEVARAALRGRLDDQRWNRRRLSKDRRVELATILDEATRILLSALEARAL